jgi:hypothetical protein
MQTIISSMCRYTKNQESMQENNSHHLPTSTQSIFFGTFTNINANNYFPIFNQYLKIKHQHK